MNYFNLAGQAIEEMVQTHYDEDSGNWATIVPMDDQAGWGLNLPTWATLATEIIQNFDALVGGDINVPNIAIQNAGSSPLDQFQAYLAAKADHRDARALFLRTIVPLAEWEQ